MEESRPNIDELFSKAKTAKVDYSIERVATVISLTATAGVAVAAGSSSIFKLSTMWITLGSMATIVSTVAIINASSSAPVSEQRSTIGQSVIQPIPELQEELIVESDEQQIHPTIPSIKRNDVDKIETVLPAMIPLDSVDRLEIDLKPETVPNQEEMSAAIAIGEFHSISLNAGINVRLQAATKSSIDYEGEEELFNLLSFVVSDGILSIDIKSGFERQYSKIGNSNNFELILNMPLLKMVAINGSGSVSSKDRIESNDLTIFVNGSGEVSFTKVLPKSVSISVNGSGDVSLYSIGTIDEGEVIINGSGDVCTKATSIKDLDVTIIGSGDANVRADDHLTISITGSGDVCYSGSADVNTTIIGSGEINRCE